MGLWDYPDVISELMDLGTVLKIIRQGKYDNVNDVRDDVRTVFNNCMVSDVVERLFVVCVFFLFRVFVVGLQNILINL